MPKRRRANPGGMAFPIEDGARKPPRGCWPCPACGAELPADAAPLDSIVLCARCCTALFWDGVYTVLSEAEIAQLPEKDRARLHALAAAQRAHLDSLGRSN